MLDGTDINEEDLKAIQSQLKTLYQVRIVLVLAAAVADDREYGGVENASG